MRPSIIMGLTAAVLVGIAGIVLGMGVYLDHTGGKFWFYWIAPALMLGTGAILASLAWGYWVKVGRLEVKGRPRSD